MSHYRQLGLFVTESCNLRCPYCFAANMERRFIDEAVARRALELFLGPDNEEREVGLTFWGGEPLLSFTLLEALVLHAEKLAGDCGKQLRCCVPTNLTLLDEEKLEFFLAHDVQLSLSLDGDEAAQGLRRTRGGRSSFPLIREKLDLLHQRCGRHLPSVRMTVSPATARDFFGNVRFFIDQGLVRITFAPVVEAAWTEQELAAFEKGQRELAQVWIERLLQGRRLVLGTWDRALAWRELRRRGAIGPQKSVLCGAGSAMLAVDIHGEIYPCHRFVFYDKKVRAKALGSVSAGLPDAAGAAPLVRPDPPRVGTPGQRCADCEQHDSCHVLCPALNYALGGDIHVVHERLCQMARIECRVIDEIEAKVGEHPRFRQHVGEDLMGIYSPGTLSVSISTLHSRLLEADPEQLAERADEILSDLQARRSGR